MKKLTSFIISTLTISGSLTLLTANASLLSGTIDRSSEDYASVMEGYAQIDDSGVFYDWWYHPPRENAPDYKVYAYEDGSRFIYEELYCEVFSFTLKEVTDFEQTDAQISELISSYDNTYYYHSYVNNEGYYTYHVYTRNQLPQNIYNGRFICEELRNQDMISDFYYGKNYNSWTVIYADLLRYDIDNKEQLEQYIIDNDLDCEVTTFFETYDSSAYEQCRVVPNNELTVEEKLSLVKKISDDLGFYTHLLCPEIAYPSFVDTFDLYNAKYGDLDSDGAVNALDASNILTYYADSQTGNTDIYTDENIADISLLGDYDADGAVNALDASLVLKEYAEAQTN